MPTVHHPRVRDDVDGPLPARVTVRGRSFDVADDGAVSLPDAQHVAELARAYGLDPSDLRVTETCDAVKSDGEVCGRELPCPYHDDGGSD